MLGKSKFVLISSGNHTHAEIQVTGTLEKNLSSTIGPPAGIDPTPIVRSQTFNQLKHSAIIVIR